MSVMVNHPENRASRILSFGQYRTLCAGILLFWIGSLCAGDSLTVVQANGNRLGIPALARGDSTYLSVPLLAQALGGSFHWDPFRDLLELRFEERRIRVYANNPFVLAGSSSFQCLPAPFLQKGDMLAPAEPWLYVLNSVLALNLIWEPSKNEITVTMMNVKLMGIEVKSDKPKTRVEIITSGPAQFNSEHKGRTLVVEIPDALVASTQVSSTQTRGLIQSYETFQLAQSAQVSLLLVSGDCIPSIEHARNPDRIVIEIKRDPSQKRKTGESATRSTRQTRLDRITTIVIDPGHGGKDPGAVGWKKLEEKKIVLQIAKKLHSRLKKKTDMKVILTRDTDVFIRLRERTRIANDTGAHLFLSIHCNSIGGSARKKRQTYGFKAYINSAAKSNEDRLVAMKENSVIQFETEEEKAKLTTTEGILFDMLSNEYLRESEDWAGMIVEEMEKRLKNTRKQHTGIGQARFYVLNGAFMPSVLMEVAYISNPNESQILKSQRFQNRVADAFLAAILRFKKKYEKKG